ncbi:hypothetical protein PGT21_009072 [Puccinia graminis f. sp. tritici]|uniref:Phosphoribulokinase/uridine kinase domain-containing protein n=1 Tax=Puccinia graminis f. sp. tritici TaxID=56615 RepID=A0A5B0PMH5_PUCGR|nr:hypothetical protein PGT21_009072 [Puccinia graminis f. sp. tritici]
MDEQLEQLSATIITHADRFFLQQDREEEEEGKENHKRYLVAIAGRPGSGKTTIARKLCRLINQHYVHQRRGLSEGEEKREERPMDSNDDVGTVDQSTRHHQDHGIATVISLDGWHYPRSVLDQFEDPAEAHRRRGSVETFDGRSYREFVEELVTSGGRSELRAPGFSHTKKDPIAGAIGIYPWHRIVLLEGLYTLLETPPDWRVASALIHLPIRIDVAPSVAKNRLVRRHLLSGIAADPELAAQRVDSNDLPNGEYLLNHSREPAIVISSVEDPTLTNTHETP